MEMDSRVLKVPTTHEYRLIQGDIFALLRRELVYLNCMLV
jgi:hypothetical protein